MQQIPHVLLVLANRVQASTLNQCAYETAKIHQVRAYLATLHTYAQSYLPPCLVHSLRRAFAPPAAASLHLERTRPAQAGQPYAHGPAPARPPSCERRVV
jgi:hypothetical protein